MLAATALPAQESPYFVTYDHHLEEPGNLEISTFSTTGIPRSGQNLFFAPYGEFEYGLTPRWTTELYLEGQAASGEGGLFTGVRLENRFRPLKREYPVNPVLYLEYEHTSEGSRILKEVVGNDGDVVDSNSLAGGVWNKELETKLILSSNRHDWNLAGNFIAEKNFSAHEGIEFGYALGASRPLATMASGGNCVWCRENFVAGVELYGGLGTTYGFGLHDTSHYVAPVVSWQVGNSSTLSFSPAIGWTRQSTPRLLRLGYSYEVRDGRQNCALVRRAPLMRSGPLTAAGMLLLSPVLCAQNTAYQPDPGWHAPLDAAARPNPLTHRSGAMAGGRKLFQRNRVECHGEDGSGLVKKHAADLQLPVVQEQTDGALVWKITNGNPDRRMHSFSRLPETKRWQIILHLRSLKEGRAPVSN
ncbi:MAG TPA: hypothetical protein VEI01_20930 [Terriglobales bacterium]|nr:hypothetical protein [Terriglobales bacterium]